MTPFQVFMAYAKIRGIIPVLKKMENYEIKKYYDFNSSSYKTLYGNFMDIFNSYFKDTGFGYCLFDSILSYYNKNLYWNDEIDYARRRWDYFVKNNVHLKMQMTTNSNVTAIVNQTTLVGKIEGVSNDHFFVKIKNNRATYRIKIWEIVEVDGKPFVLDFFITWKGKEYGKDKNEMTKS